MTAHQAAASLQLAPPARRLGVDLAVAVVAAGLLLLWDSSTLDIKLLSRWGDADGFAWQEHWLAQGVLHDGGRLVGFMLLGLLLVNLRWPLWRGLSPAERWRWLGMTLVCLLAVPLLKKLSPTSCPWDLAMFGGVADYLSHWQWRSADGGPGGCFPSGHAVAAFAFFSGYFALRQAQPAQARRWLIGVLVMGAVFGWAQMARGAHFPSHTMWSAWVCWVLCALLSAVPLQGPQARL